MGRSKVAISLDQHLLRRLDRLVEGAVFPSRSQAIQVAVEEKLERMERDRLARECARLNPDFEKSLAEESLPEPSEDKLEEEELQAVLLATQTSFGEIKSGCSSIVKRIDSVLGYVRGEEDA